MKRSYLPAKPYIGTRDFYPDEMKFRNWYFSKMRQVVETFGFEEIGGPILESFDVFAAKSGEEIVRDQVYHFTDRGDRHLAIRPEMTPTVARMAAGKIGELRFPVRWYSIANFMRYERPQKGRLREFYQLNVDLLGDSQVKSDLEVILVAIELLKVFGADETMFQVKLNNRKLFNQVILEFIGVSPDQIQVISKAIDKKAKMSEDKYNSWLLESGLSKDQIIRLNEVFSLSLDDLVGHLEVPEEGAEEIKELFILLEQAGVSQYCRFDFSIVRGLDYYTGNIFEVNDLNPDNRRALFGGGRYDNLVGLFSSQAVSGVGFGFGDVTFQHFLEGHSLVSKDLLKSKKVMIAVFEGVDFSHYLKLSQELRQVGIGNFIFSGANLKFKKQLQYAQNQGISTILLLGDDELKVGKITIKDLETGKQVEVPRNEMIANLNQNMYG